MAQYAVIPAGVQIYGMSVGIKIIIFNYLFFFFQVTAICRNDNPNAFDPFAVEVSISRMSYITILSLYSVLMCI